jgi:RNA polymerase sigma-70 factor (ECF subfamily)
MFDEGGFPGRRFALRLTTLESKPQGAIDPLEAGLIEKARGGNLFAFEEIVKRYQRRVYGTALRITKRHDIADDVTQETFLRAHQALARFDATRPFGPWICRIAANLAINHVRSPASREEGLPEGHQEEPSPAASPLQGVLDGEASRVLQDAMATLPPEQRAVFVLRAFEDLSYQEIAEALAISPGTVMSRLSRAREKLRLALAPYMRTPQRAAGAGEA